MRDWPCEWELQACTGDSASHGGDRKSIAQAMKVAENFAKRLIKERPTFFSRYGQKAVRVHTHQPGPKTTEVNGNSPKNAEQMLYS